MLSRLDRDLLQKIAGIHGATGGAFSIRKDGEGYEKHSSANISVETKKDNPGIDVNIRPGTKNESVHVPVIITGSGIHDKVWNTFNVGSGSDITIVAGCGIHNPGEKETGHDGIHEFVIGRNARMKYVETHYAQGEGLGKKIFNPVTVIRAEEGACVELELIQIRGVDHTVRKTEIFLEKNATLHSMERMLTTGSQDAESIIRAELAGEGSSARIVSRSVARDSSFQKFDLNLVGMNKSFGHIECDAIIMDDAKVISIPKLEALHTDAELIHEAAIGKIASEQLNKLMSLGLTAEEAEEAILSGFLK